MRVDEALARLGGVGTARSLLRLVSEKSIRKAVEDGSIRKEARGRYSLCSVGDAVQSAHALAGTVSHLSAAHFWGWELKTIPAQPHVTVPRNRKVSRERQRGATVHWATLHEDDRRAPGVTAWMRTLTDCLSTCPFDEALAVADSALRHRAVTHPTLVAEVARLRGPGSAAALNVALRADGRAANPFESVLRAIAIEVGGLHLVPQVPITGPGFYARPDLVDVDRRLVLEADSHTWHSSRDALRRDCRRYNALVLLGWTVLRFTWEDVMLRPHVVAADLELFKRAQPRPRRSKAT